MSHRKTVPPTRKQVRGVAQKEVTEETHPSWVLISAKRYSTGPGGAVLFDSDIKHQHTVGVTISRVSRQRDLSRDWLHGEQEFLNIEMSEAQWASFVSSMGEGQGVPATLRRHNDDVFIPGEPHEPRLEESINEVEGAAEKTFAAIQEAFDAYDEKRNAANRRNLKAAIANAKANLKFTADSMTEHAENVVQKARFDIEAMVAQAAERKGLEPGDLGDLPALEPADDPEVVEEE